MLTDQEILNEGRDVLRIESEAIDGIQEVLGNLFTGALSERLDNKKLVFELNEGSLNLRIF